jgi:hypothetical protein
MRALLILLLLCSGCAQWPICTPPVDPPVDPPAETNAPPVVVEPPADPVVFVNPVIADPSDIAELCNWKVYVPDMAGNTHAGRRFTMKWASHFYRVMGCRKEDTACLVNGVLLPFYQLDTGETLNAARLCYTDSSRDPASLPDPVLVELVRGGQLIGCVLITNPTNGVKPRPDGGTSSVSRWEPLPEKVVLP